MNSNRKYNTKVVCQLFQYPETSEKLLKVFSADVVYVRGDYNSGNLDYSFLSNINGESIFSLKSIEFGGKSSIELGQRHKVLTSVSEQFDFIELEFDKDLTDEILYKIPVERRIISWYGRVDSYEALREVYANLQKVESAYYKIVAEPRSMSDCIYPLRLLQSQEDSKLIAYANGATGVWTQVLASFMGSPLVIGNIDDRFEKESHLLYDRLMSDYKLPDTRTIKHIYGIAGNPVFSSMSPLIHNECYAQLNMEALYLPFHISDFNDFWGFISANELKIHLGLSIQGFTMVSPFKEETFRVADRHLCTSTEISKACNILVKHQDKWCSDSSDGLGVINALEKENIDLQPKKVAIIGCGGAGRTIAARLKAYGPDISFFNRSEKRGIYASDILEIPYFPLKDFDPSLFDIVINATPVGKHGKTLIFDPSRLKEGSITIDMSYAKDETLLVEGCRKHGKRIIEGKQILLYQVKKQFNRLTDEFMPKEVEYMVREKTANYIDLD